MNELLRSATDLGPRDQEWLRVLVADWQLLADLSFSDLVLWVPVTGSPEYLAVAQLRPTTGPTAFQDDVVGTRLARGAVPTLDTALDTASIVRGGDAQWRLEVAARSEAIPVCRGGRVLGVIARTTSLVSVRTPSRLELTYLGCAAELARMIATGLFPHPSVGGQVEAAFGDGSPRVGDGLIRLDANGLVDYASPNALSAYRRLGLATDLVGTHLGTITAGLAPGAGPVEEAVAVVAGGRVPRAIQIEARAAVVRLRSIPLVDTEHHLGALVLLRDVTELRRREQELMTKDATIREIHHRVKNNLQAVAALLRMQARRLDEPSGRAALQEAERRVGSIAIVHDTLATSDDESVVFDLIVDRVLEMVTDVSGAVLVTPDRVGRFGALPGRVAGPLAMVLTELIQNALEHGLTPTSRLLRVGAEHVDGELLVEVCDDGRGLPPGFDARSSGSLGLRIVRTLVTGELGGRMDMGERPGGGTRVALAIPL
ncbi:MAG: sensor histidine kinase [Sporichthyaceae bacterium]